MEALKGPDKSKTSSKRIFGFLCFFAAVGLGFYTRDPLMVSAFLIPAAAVFGIQAWTKT